MLLSLPRLMAMSSPTAAFIFDMDGVLVDSTRHWQQVVEPFLTRHIANWDNGKALAVAGIDMHDMYRMLVSQWGFALSEPEFLRFAEVAADEVYRHRTALVPGLQDLLEVIVSSGYKTAVASSSPARWVRKVLARFELSPYFAEVVTGDDVRRGKPEPDIFLLAAKKLHTAPERCVVIEDSLAGIHAAQSAGMRCVAIDTTLPAASLGEADFVVSAMAEIRSLLADKIL